MLNAIVVVLDAQVVQDRFTMKHTLRACKIFLLQIVTGSIVIKKRIPDPKITPCCRHDAMGLLMTV